MQIPSLLKPGDHVAILSPASHPLSDQWKAGVETLEKWGLKVIRSENYLAKHHGLAGTDAQRLADLQGMLDDPTIKAIFPIRGGYGVSRILDAIDFTAFKNSQKWIVGFSDITALLTHIDALGIAGIHGPMPHNICQPGGEAALETLHSLLFTGTTTIEASPHPLNRLGTCESQVVGGNLSILVHLIGTPSFPNPAGKILLIEDVGERLYHVDRMLLQLKRAGYLRNLAGLIVGGFTNCNEASLAIGKTAYELVAEHTAEYTYPIAFDFPSGHIADNQAIPFGTVISFVVKSESIQLLGKI